MNRASLLPAICLLGLSSAAVQPAAAQCAALPGCELVWADEFDGNQVDMSKWTFQQGDGSEVGLPGGWGNNEQQYYRPENATVADGFLTITAREEPFAGHDYTSARMRTLGKGDWTYGRVEMRAKMPVGRGLWPAFWMLPSDNLYGTWAASGEIDIVEYLGQDPDRILGTIHYGGQWPGNTWASTNYTLPFGNFHDEFHTFAIEWEAEEIRWYVDGTLYALRNAWWSSGGPYPAPFNADFHILLNVAVGGNLPGPPDATTQFPQELVVDYVRVYRQPTPIELIGPVASGDIESGSDVTFSAEVLDDLDVVRVEFLQDRGFLGEDTTPPYEHTVENVSPGCYKLRVRAHYTDGQTAMSSPLPVTVGAGCPQAPYKMTPALVPGAIEAEDYDLGGPGIAYFDWSSTNFGGAYRPGDAVDIEATADEGGGFNVGWIIPSEWLEYTVDVSAGTYDLELRVASASFGGTVHLELDGVDRTGPISFGTTDGWQNWTTVTMPQVTLDAGVQTMRLVFDDGYFNVNRVSIVGMPDDVDDEGSDDEAADDEGDDESGDDEGADEDADDEDEDEDEDEDGDDGPGGRHRDSRELRQQRGPGALPDLDSGRSDVMNR